MVLTIDDCTTTLLFPFVTNRHGSIPDWLLRTRLRKPVPAPSLQRRQCTDTTDHPSRCWRGAVDSCVRDCTWLPGLLDCGLRIPGCARLCLPLQRLSGGPPTLAQGYLAVCTAGNFLQIKKGHRAAAPACEETSLTHEAKNHRGVRFQIGLPYSFIRPELSHCHPWPAACRGFPQGISRRPIPKTQCGIAPLIASAARARPFRMRCHGSAHS